jgi:hypothetical protein
MSDFCPRLTRRLIFSPWVLAGLVAAPRLGSSCVCTLNSGVRTVSIHGNVLIFSKERMKLFFGRGRRGLSRFTISAGR